MNDDLDPRLAAALRDVAPADDDVRDLHITAALAEFQARSVRPITRYFGVAAAMILLLGGVAVFRAGQNTRNSGVAAAENLVTSVPAKSGIDSSTATDNAALPVACTSTIENSQVVGEYGPGTARLAVNLNSESMEVFNPRTCASVTVFELPTLPRSRTVCIPSLIPGTELVGTYASGTTNVIVLATETELTVLGGPQCDVLARFPRPAVK